jgi:dTDP-glucose 4,6-dehydratase
LGSGKTTARNNYAYHCPFCHHAKPKLEVNLTENREGKNPWHCWACDIRGTSIYSLFKQINVAPEKLQEVSSLVKMICDRIDYIKEWEQNSQELITFVEDRKGHDFRYSINYDKIKTTLGWEPKTNFNEALDKTIDYYLKKFGN